MQTHPRFSKKQIKQAIVDALKDEREVHKIIIFGSFLKAGTPNDIDVAVVGEFHQGYLAAAIRLRRHVRHIAKILPVDIVPIQENSPPNSFMQDIFEGEVIYEG